MKKEKIETQCCFSDGCSNPAGFVVSDEKLGVIHLCEYHKAVRNGGDPVVEAVVKDLRDRSRVGQQKYGTTLAREDLSLKDWLEHQYQELLDAANYTKRAMMKMEEAE